MGEEPTGEKASREGKVATRHQEPASRTGLGPKKADRC